MVGEAGVEPAAACSQSKPSTVGLLSEGARAWTRTKISKRTRTAMGRRPPPTDPGQEKNLSFEPPLRCRRWNGRLLDWEASVSKHHKSAKVRILPRSAAGADLAAPLLPRRLRRFRMGGKL